MGLFRKFGRRVGRLTEEAREAKEAHATYRCTECEAGFYEHEGECPECGGPVVVEADDEADDEPADREQTPDSARTDDPE
ncbi:hypothetical protein [Haloarchaeobius amylolyticus]|uniref:hypothetical protein n=1 Tax=Haloarchaeobius amylolyticus TaxID=1198296 RepID=UPI0022706643|nr:hypothetical protein [Haloarchaeobius amylolyticus]